MGLSRLVFLLLVPSVAMPMVAVGQSPSASASIHDVEWLAGCWERRSGDRATIEIWMVPAGGMMLGASRTVVNGATREYEQVMIREHEGRLVFTANPSGQAEASFTSTEVTDSTFVVENLKHDFPQRITYVHTGPDAWMARVEGPGPDGMRGFELRMTRVSCVP
jgi:hypothetical protein